MSDDNDADYSHALPFDTFEDCWTESPKRWLIENVIALEEDSSWFGPPASLKSALLTDIAVHIASGRDWREYKFDRWCENPEDVDAEEKRGVVIFALERASLTRRRLAAYQTRDKLGPLPIAVINKTIDLLDPASIPIVADTISRFEVQKRCTVGLVVFDTWSKAIAAGKENDSETQNLAALHLKKIRDAAGGSFHTASIGHTGKNEAAGERGSNAKLGHVDMAVQLSGDKVRTATIVKANDQPHGPLASFEMEEITVVLPARVIPRPGHPDGDYVIEAQSYSVGILAAGTPAKEVHPSASPTLSGKHAQALDALRRAISERGQNDAVHVEFWKEELAKTGLLNLNAKNPWQPFKRIKDAVAKHIVEAGEFVRIAPPSLPSHI
ncbi:helicase RepA family protein [Bradyrhizobium barranii]|uniref:Helicase RepA family protein n=1 Tax=Bradyrhizobium barranii TaxID=2992140 RepID=A0ABY3QBJ8_9BRAD|nr:AAA family ATPase [Bradyrhizobium japonicum]UFW82989.1 helicase RepA family protein [Bradyrhizobium japonicum]